ncbi:MAG: iron ABC transporter permease [Alphaproteobacteria bacterium]|nr:iron ABC transporter permease [Alphaproteobacteria bacterium]
MSDRLIHAGLFLALAGAALIGLTVGAGDVWALDDDLRRLVLIELRLPRLLIGVIVGASLGLAGAVLQGLIRNPLVEPGVIGISGSAALGAVAVFYTGLAATLPLALPLGGIVGAALAVLVLAIFARRSADTTTLLLAGIGLSAISGALVALALNLAPNPFAVYDIALWLLGSFTDRGLDHVALAGPLAVIGWALLLTTGRDLDALALGEDTARSLGVGLGALSSRVVLGTALAVGASVAVAGTVGFIGLVVPHLLRPFLGARPGRLLLASALGGAILAVAADILVRLVPTGQELKIGVVTALLGAPIFLRLVLRHHRGRVA